MSMMDISKTSVLVYSDCDDFHFSRKKILMLFTCNSILYHKKILTNVTTNPWYSFDVVPLQVSVMAVPGRR